MGRMNRHQWILCTQRKHDETPSRAKPHRYGKCPTCKQPTRGTETTDPRCAKCQAEANAKVEASRAAAA